VLSGGQNVRTTPCTDGYYLFDHLKAGEEYTVTIMYYPPPPEVVITQPVDLSSVTGNTEIIADVTSEVCMYEFIPPAHTYAELTYSRTNQDFITGSPSDCCMTVNRVDYVITGNSGQSDTYTDTTPSMCNRSYSHIWDFSKFPDWNCTITVQVTDEAGKTDSDMISVFNDEYPTPTPTPGSIENPGAVWVSPKESIAAKDTAFATDILANSGDLLIGAYGFELTYNPDVILVDVSKGQNGVEAGADGFFAAVNAETPGTLFYSGFDPYGTGPGAALQLLVVYWLAVEEGTSPIDLRISSLADSNADSFEDPQGISGTVTVLPPGLMGDVNGVAFVDIVDALLVAQYYVGFDPAGFSPTCADANCDGNLDIVDALLIAQFYVGLIADVC
jgi:hypothetical protein